jgi:hypothetical protein
MYGSSPQDAIGQYAGHNALLWYRLARLTRIDATQLVLLHLRVVLRLDIQPITPQYEPGPGSCCER